MADGHDLVRADSILLPIALALCVAVLAEVVAVVVGPVIVSMTCSPRILYIAVPSNPGTVRNKALSKV